MHTSIPHSDYGGIHPELAARITAAKAVLGDFRHDDNEFMSNHGPMPHYPTWAGRLATELSDTLAMLERLVAYRPSAGPAGTKYRKIFTPEARQFAESADAIELAAWCGGILCSHPDRDVKYIVIATHQGEQRAHPGDWILHGEGGEFYPVKPEVFDNTYERVEVTQ